MTDDKSKVFGGIGGDMIKKLSDVLFNELNKLFDIGLKIDDIKQDTDESDGSTFTTFDIDAGAGNILHVLVEEDLDGNFHVQIKDDGSNEYDEEDVDESELEDLFYDIIEEWYGTDLSSSTKSSGNRAVLGFTKHDCGDAWEIDVDYVHCPHTHIEQSFDAASELMDDAEFVDSIPEGESAYTVYLDDPELHLECVEEDDYNISEDYNMVLPAMTVGQQLVNGCTTLIWNNLDAYNATANLHQLRFVVQNHLSNLALYSYDMYGYAPNCDSLCYGTSYHFSQPISDDELISKLCTYIDVLTVLSHEAEKFTDDMNVIINVGLMIEQAQEFYQKLS